MSNFFETKKAALRAAIGWTGGSRDQLNKEANTIQLEQFGSYVGDAEVYTIPNLHGENARFGIVKEPRGWTVWFIGDNGVVIRA